MDCAWSFQRRILNCFYSYGYLLARYPLYFLLTPLVICGILGTGILSIEKKTGVEYLYAPSFSRSLDDREIVKGTFTDDSDTNFSPFSLNELIPESVIIFRSKQDKSILTEKVINELHSFYNEVMALNQYTVDGRIIDYRHVCKKQGGVCVIFGSFVFENDFLNGADLPTRRSNIESQQMNKVVPCLGHGPVSLSAGVSV